MKKTPLNLKIQEIHKHKIPSDRKILLRKKKKLNLKLKRCNTRERNCIESAIIDIDKKLLDSHKNEKIESETRAIKNIKINPKHFFTCNKET